MSKEDQKILGGLISKNEKILFDFYKKYYPLVFRFVNRQIKDRLTVEEIVNDTFFDFLEKTRDFRGESSLKTYLFSIARHKTIDFIRKKKIEKILFSALPSYLVEGLKVILLDKEIEKKELAKKINHVFKKLPNDYQLVLRLKYIEGEKVKSIAKKLSRRFKATESLIFRAKKAFIKIFNSLS
ncbi:MAG: RNA polymerase sigma factor [Microgenomates group bacterium]